MPASDHINCCPQGAGLYTGMTGIFPDSKLGPVTTESGAPMPTMTVQQPSQMQLLNMAETSYPVGSQAQLAAPFPVDRGIWMEPRLVQTFVKTPNNRWTSYPGNDVNYPTLSALALAAPVQTVIIPGQGTPMDDPTFNEPMTGQMQLMVMPPEPMIDPDVAAAVAPVQAQAARKTNTALLWLLGGAAVIGLIWFTGRRRRH